MLSDGVRLFVDSPVASVMKSNAKLNNPPNAKLVGGDECRDRRLPIRHPFFGFVSKNLSVAKSVRKPPEV